MKEDFGPSMQPISGVPMLIRKAGWPSEKAFSPAFEGRRDTPSAIPRKCAWCGSPRQKPVSAAARHPLNRLLRIQLLSRRRRLDLLARGLCRCVALLQLRWPLDLY